MTNEWDVVDNSVDTEAIRRKREMEERQERWRTEREERERLRTERRRAQGYFVPNGLDDSELVAHFPHYIGRTETFRNIYTNSTYAAEWLANKLYYVCHNCGTLGYKLTEDISELFKCPYCRSRYIDVLRSGEISLAIRESEYGLDMREVYDGRRERLRTARLERAAARRNS